MRIGTVFELMIDGPKSPVRSSAIGIRSRSASTAHSGSTAPPGLRRSDCSQQIVSIALLGSLELRFIRAKRECRARDFLVFFRKPDLYEAESAPCLFLRRTDAQQ